MAIEEAISFPRAFKGTGHKFATSGGKKKKKALPGQLDSFFFFFFFIVLQLMTLFAAYFIRDINDD